MSTLQNKVFGTNIRVTASSNQGGRKYMEDFFSIVYKRTADERDMDYVYFGIFDGHGGKEAAQFAKEHLLECILKAKNFRSENDEDVLHAIREGFFECHNMMWRALDAWPKTFTGQPSTSGSTASIMFIMRGKLFIGHCGDSGIVMGTRDVGTDKFVGVQLTRDHKPESPEEKKRIESVGGAVLEKAGVQRVAWHRPKPSHRGPIRRSTQVECVPFLAVARSLGDLWSYNFQSEDYAVSPEPDVFCVPIDPVRHKCLVLASDGLWNMLNAQAAVSVVEEAERIQERQFVQRHEEKRHFSSASAVNPSQMLVAKALKRWAARGARADNTTAVTVMLDPLGPARNDVMARQMQMKRLRPRDSPVLKNLFLTDFEVPTSKVPLVFSRSYLSNGDTPPQIPELRPNKPALMNSAPGKLGSTAAVGRIRSNMGGAINFLGQQRSQPSPSCRVPSTALSANSPPSASLSNGTLHLPSNSSADRPENEAVSTTPSLPLDAADTPASTAAATNMTVVPQLRSNGPEAAATDDESEPSQTRTLPIGSAADRRSCGRRNMLLSMAGIAGAEQARNMRAHGARRQARSLPQSHHITAAATGRRQLRKRKSEVIVTSNNRTAARNKLRKLSTITSSSTNNVVTRRAAAAVLRRSINKSKAYM